MANIGTVEVKVNAGELEKYADEMKLGVNKIESHIFGNK